VAQHVFRVLIKGLYKMILSVLLSYKARLTVFVLANLLILTACQPDSQRASPRQAKTKLTSTTMSKFSRLKQLEHAAPIAAKQNHIAEHHGETLSDDYHWLKDQGYPEVNDEPVLDYLKAENAYYAKFLEPNRPLVDTIFSEFKGRTDEEETSVPYVSNGYEYRWFFKPGADYRVRERKNLETSEVSIFLDENVLAEGHEYFVLGDWEISPDNKYLAYSFNTAGDERYEVVVIDLSTGKTLDDKLIDVSGELAFSSDSKKLMYALLEKDRWHAKHIKVHELGTNQAADKTIFFEEDDGFFIGFGRTSSKQYMLIVSTQGETEEAYALKADFSGTPQMIVSRDKEFSQSIDHAHGHFYILANDTHKNFRLVRAPESEPSEKNWETLIEGSDDSYLLNLQTFDDFIALKSRDNGLEKVYVRGYPSDSQGGTEGESKEVVFPETVFTASIGINPEFKQDHLRLSYESMITPSTVFDYQISDASLVTKKVKKIPSGYDKSQYLTERIMVPARDGANVPVSLVYKKGFERDGSHPLWLYGYGAYAATIEPNFSALRLSALDRGFVYAIAHVRGGAMMGYRWYLDGKLDKRTNTFNDFVDVAEHLVKENYVAAGNISISGRSAGGELMGAAVVQAPELWRSVNLGVPFVDVLNTMLDASLPLTPPEWKEWGNPVESAEAFKFIQSYSPYDNIKAREYPPMFVSGGVNDPRVTYWEPAKWTAKMRDQKTDDNLLVMRINMGAGHFSNSGRYGRLKDYAEEYAFMFLSHGIDE